MATTIKSFISDKGGVGKTTLSLNYGAYCKELLGKDVLFVDLDPQQSGKKFCSNIGIEYANSIPISMNKFDVVIIDYPPTATLKQEPIGEVVLIANPTYLSIISMIQGSKKYHSPVFLVNKFFENRKDHRAIIEQVAQLPEVDEILVYKEYSAVQRAENVITSMFSLKPSDASDIYNLDKAKSELVEVFKKL